MPKMVENAFMLLYTIIEFLDAEITAAFIKQPNADYVVKSILMRIWNI